MLQCHIIHQRDLYEVLYTEEGDITQVTLFPDNMNAIGQVVDYSTLPNQLQHKIQDHIFINSNEHYSS